MKIVIVLMLIVPSSFSLAASNVVPDVIQRSSEQHEVPAALMYAIMIAESQDPNNPQRGPWPWSINHRNKSLFFETRQEAYQYILPFYLLGDTNFDVGWAQISWRWNGHLFDRLWSAFDPTINVSAGCAVLRSFYLRSGSYYKAVALYHTEDNKRGQLYRARIIDILAKLNLPYQLKPGV